MRWMFEGRTSPAACLGSNAEQRLVFLTIGLRHTINHEGEMFSRTKKLYEMDPETLDMEKLLHLQAALLAKLSTVTSVMKRRYAALAEVANSMNPESDEAVYFTTEAQRMNGIFLFSDNVLAQQIGKVPSGNAYPRSWKSRS